MNANIENPWINTLVKMPDLLPPKHKDDVLQSKEVFFSLSYSGGIYHGWYISRPVRKDAFCLCDCDCCCESEDGNNYEYENFFNSNVGDELFSEDSVEFWMYKPDLPNEKSDEIEEL